MSIWLVVWVFLMLFWLFGGGYYIYSRPDPSPIAFGSNTLIPWFCVLILGLVVFGAVPAAQPQTPAPPPGYYPPR